MPDADERPAPLLVDPLLSWARREVDGVRVVIRLREGQLMPGVPADDGLALLLRRKAAESVRAPVQVREDGGGHVLTASVSSSELGGSGTWRLALKTPGRGAPRPLRTRLLLRPDQPVALLPPFAAEDLGN